MLSLLFVYVFIPCFSSSSLHTVGNLAVVAKPRGIFGSPEHPLSADIDDLWCSLTKLGESLPLAYAQFVRVRDDKTFEATSLSDHKAVIHLGSTPVTAAGKYRCELRSDEGEIGTGNTFIYVEPVLLFPSPIAVHIVPNSRHSIVGGPDIHVTDGDDVTMDCPAFGFPEPFVRWEKDGDKLPSDLTVVHDGNKMTIHNVNHFAAGLFRCVAENGFPMFVGGPQMPHSVYYERRLIVD